MRREYWAINSERFGGGAYWERREDAENEREEHLECYPDDKVTIVSKEMTPEQYEALPEFEGF